MLVFCQDAAGKLTIAVTGATGLVGSRLTAKLASQGNKVRVLTRNPASARAKLQYPGLEFYEPAKWCEGIQGCDGVVNLAGEPIATRWNEQLKGEIKRSRVKTTKAVAECISNCPEDKRPKVLVSSSAVGFYGSSQTATFNEESPSGKDYLSEVCRDWESAARSVPSDVRVCILRTGIVLAREGGALGRMLPIFQVFAGGPLGSGRQWMSWIHRDDLVDLVVEAVKNKNYVGTYNATAPKPVTMAELCSTLGNVLGRPSWLPVPEFALQTLLGEGASVVLEGQRVLPLRTQQQGFAFKYGTVADALKNILK